MEQGGWLRPEGRVGSGGVGWSGVGWGVCSAKGLLSHSQSARKKKRKAGSVQHQRTQSRSTDKETRRAKRQSSRWGEDNEGFIRGFAHQVHLFLFFVAATFTQPPGCWMPQLRYALIMQRAKKKKNTQKQSKKQATPAVPLHEGTVGDRDEGMR